MQKALASRMCWSQNLTVCMERQHRAREAQAATRLQAILRGIIGNERLAMALTKPLQAYRERMWEEGRRVELTFV